MSSETSQLHIFFLPLTTAQGHIIPMIDMAKLFARKGTNATIITTPQNQPHISKAIESTRSQGHNINILTITFPLPPTNEAPPPQGSTSLLQKLLRLSTLIRQPIQQLLQDHRPDCLVSDMFLPWTTDVAAERGIPRIVFHGTGFFALSAIECIRLHEPQKKVSSDLEPFVLPNFPGEIKMLGSQLQPFLRQESEFGRFYGEVKESEIRSYGVLVNSFYELEQAYADHYRKVQGRRAWHIGPLSLWDDGEANNKSERGKSPAIREDECLEWLGSKRPKSVAYICFGSAAKFDSPQLLEIAKGLEASKQQFIWVVKKEKNQEEGNEDWLPQGFEEKMGGKGLIIRGWAPQVLILGHQAIGGFVTHCGWNSVLEAVCAGVPMVTWPVEAEQFYNEKLVTEILGIGIGVGAKKWAFPTGDFVRRAAIEKAVEELMTGEGVEEMRRRAKSCAEMARKAIQNGGSSESDLNALIKELSLHRTSKHQNELVH